MYVFYIKKTCLNLRINETLCDIEFCESINHSFLQYQFSTVLLAMLTTVWSCNLTDLFGSLGFFHREKNGCFV